MNQKDIFIKAVRDADISNEDWVEDCFPLLVGLPFARGYITRLCEELGNSLDTRSEDYREAILKTEDATIWK